MQSTGFKDMNGTFSPLFIGVIGATSPASTLMVSMYTFSPLFIGVIGATL